MPPPPVLSYARPPFWRNPYAAAILFVSMLPILLINRGGGRWYFGHQPTWVFSVDPSGIDLGPSGRPFHVAAYVWLTVRIVIVGIPPLLVYRHFARPARSTDDG